MSNADHITPPKSTDTDIIVAATVGGTLSAAIDLSAFKGRYINVSCDDGVSASQPFYIQFATTGGTSASATRTSTSGATRMDFCAAKEPFEIDSASVECRIMPTANGYLRIVSSGPRG
jgi:hypothetical protein